MTTRTYPDQGISFDEAGDGPPLVLLHAFPQTRKMWQPQLKDLSRDFRLLCPDLPGFGDSRSSSTCSIDGMADGIAAWLKSLGIEKAIIGGVSMGGYVALALARRHSELLRGLILASTRADADSEEARAGRETMIAFAREHSAREVFEKMAPRLFSEATWREQPQLIEQAARIAEPIPSSTITATLQALRDRPDARPSLPQIAVPTLILIGDEDVVSPLESAREMAAAIPNAQLQVLVGAGHFTHMEAAEAWSQAVHEWAPRI